MLHNNGNGTFSDVSKRSGTTVTGWTVPAAFFDYDRDGWLDLYVGSYLRYSVEGATQCFSPSGALDYCTPNSYRPLPGRLFHNSHDGTFTDVTAKARIASEFGPALGVSTADFNGDGWIDLYIANDSQPNQLWTNQHDGTFRNTALLAGAALTQEGKAEASDLPVDNDGDEDVFITEQTGEGHNLSQRRPRWFESRLAIGTRGGSLGNPGSDGWFDYGNDGWLDLLAVSEQSNHSAARAGYDRFHQQKQLFRNAGTGAFRTSADQPGSCSSCLKSDAAPRSAISANDGGADVASRTWRTAAALVKRGSRNIGSACG